MRSFKRVNFFRGCSVNHRNFVLSIILFAFYAFNNGRLTTDNEHLICVKLTAHNTGLPGN